MYTVMAWLVVAALIVMLVAVAYVALKDRKKYQKETKRLAEELEAQKQISAELVEYTKQIAKINGDKDKFADQKNEAENDEEVLNIIAGLVITNNNRVRDKAKG